MGFKVMLVKNSNAPHSVSYVRGDSFKDEKLKTLLNSKCNLDLIWGGQMRFKDIDRVHLSDCRMAMLVFETKDRAGYDHVKEWVLKIRALYPRIYIVFTGNKSTATEYQAVTADEAQEFAKLHRIWYNETSCFTKMFERIKRDH